MKKIDSNQFVELVTHQGTVLFLIAYMNGDVNQSQLHMIQTRVGKWYKLECKDPQNWEQKAEVTTNALLSKFIRIKTDELETQFRVSTTKLANLLSNPSSGSKRLRTRILKDWVSVMSVGGGFGQSQSKFINACSPIVGCDPSHFSHLVNEAINQQPDALTGHADDILNASATAVTVANLGKQADESEEDIDLNDLLFGDDEHDSFNMTPD